MEDGMKILVVYAGRVAGKNRKTYHLYYPLDNITKSHQLIFSKKVTPHDSVGNIIEATSVENGLRGPYKFIRKHRDEKIVAEWYANDHAATNKIRIDREAKKDSNPLYDRAMRDLLSVYKSLPRGYPRDAFFLKILKDLQNG